MSKKKLFLSNYTQAISILGESDRNIKDIENEHNVKVLSFEDPKTNKYVIEVSGKKTKVDNAFESLLDLKNKTMPTNPEKPGPANSCPEPGQSAVYNTFSGKQIRSLSANQKAYIDAINKYDLVFGIGPAGTGKTFLAVAAALTMLESGKVSKIVITRPVVESGEKLGFLPGDLYEKINPYLRPLYDAFYSMIGPERFRRYRDDDTIEIVPLAYMRGRTLENAFIILDEAQNTVPEQMKMFLTRLGFNSQAVITGDVTQIDLENKKQSGLVLSEKILNKIEAIKFIHFTDKDVVRHKLVKEIIKAYEIWENRKDK
ncbi:MAG: PhoH family protein [Elusimicrobia bacterium]|nr:PhoH family protein [Elusimicrobiota bacterium]